MSNIVSLSASKIQTYLTCSYRAWLTYHLKFPRISNNGQKIGSATHDTIEFITKDKRLKYHNTPSDSIKYLYSKGVQKLINRMLDKYSIKSEENIAKINSFIGVAIKNDLINKNSIKFYTELPFEIKTDLYTIVGRIDQVAIYEDRIVVRDWKTSVSKPPGFNKNEYLNLQGLIYEWAVRQLFGADKNVEVDFLYLKFKKAPLVKSESNNHDLLSGLVQWLDYIATYIKNFTFKEAISNLAYSNGNRFSLGGCGGRLGELTSTGKEAYVCEMKYPREFYVLRRGDKVIQSAFLEKDLDKKQDGDIVERRFHSGCPAWQKLLEKQD